MCVSPITLTREDPVNGRKYLVHVPCGKCAECIKDRQNEYVIRSVEEGYKAEEDVWFLTLTYSNDTVPVTFDDDGEIVDEFTGEITNYDGLGELLTIDNKDITDWKKRCKKAIETKTGQRLDYSYLICGEYGPKTHRPHYHGIFMNLTPEQVQVFVDDWKTKKGYVCCKKVNRFQLDRVGAYVSKYITKQIELEDELVLSGKVAKPRKIVSVGYGMPTKKRFDMMRHDIMGDLLCEIDPDKLDNINPIKLQKEVKRMTKRKKYKLNGREYKLPSYYWKKLTYVKDEVTGKVRSTKLSHLVSQAIQRHVQTDFIEKCIEMANDYDMPESYETYSIVSKRVCDNEEDMRQSRAKTIIEYNKSVFRKSRF